MENLFNEIDRIGIKLEELGIESKLNFLQGILNNIKKTLKKKKYDLNYDLFSLLLLERGLLRKEVDEFLVDFNEYNNGIYLWAYDRYPRVMKFLELILKDFPKIEVLNGMENVVYEYFNFIKRVKSKNPILFKEELLESKNQLFDITIKPIKILQKKNPFFNFVISNISNNLTEIIEEYKENTKDYFPKFTKIIEKYGEKFIIYFEKQKQLLERAKNSELDFEEFKKEIEKEQFEFDNIIENFQKQEDLIKLEVKEYKKKFKEATKIPSENLKKLNDLISDVLSQDPSQMIYRYIVLMKDIDSFNIHFVKYLRRLFHILTMNNRDFKTKKNCFYLINTKKYIPPRDKLKSFLGQNLKILYPNLANFMIKGFKYNKFRRLEAHEIPDNIKISHDKEIAYIPQTGTRPELQMNIKEIKQVINTYCLFINAIGI